MSEDLDANISLSLMQLLPLHAFGAACRIGKRDGGLLTAAEAELFHGATAARRAASGAARGLARSLLRRMGIQPADILRSCGGAPIWPAGIVGSLAHDEEVAVAAVGPSRSFGGLGIDVEIASPLEDEVADIVVNAYERRLFNNDPYQLKMAFCIKESVFKAVNPFDSIFLEFQDVTIDPASGTATTSYGRVVNWRAEIQPVVMAVAWW